MKKLIFALFIVGIAFQVKAETYTNGPQLESLKSGVLIAMGEKTICTFPLLAAGYNVDVLIQHANEVELTEGPQPLITFLTVTTNTGNVDMTKTVVTTSSDFKNIVKIEVIGFRKGKINLGDLKNPNISEGYIRDDRICMIVPSK